ncbi:MAG TPA: hypothetical protein VGS18_02080, partial [Thermoplasmata archaeon]|nr:hypothetical protein [Thermoplasmata archaeon]
QVFNPPCFPVTKTTCVRLSSPSTPNIIPTGNNHTASYMPNATDNIVLYLMSESELVWRGALSNGPHSPIALNVSGVLWNGDPWMCSCDSSIWHANGNTWYQEQTGLLGANKTYPYVYSLTISNKSTSGFPNFFAGETVTWWIYIVNYTATSGVYRGNLSVPLSYRVAGAWAFSPHPGAAQYAGPNASVGDLTTAHSPLVPNWNDTVNVTIAVTFADRTNRSAIKSATLFVEDVRRGVLLANATQLLFPIASAGLVTGTDRSNVTIPSGFTQVAGDQILFWVSAVDTANYETNSIVLPVQSFVVNGNGSFSSGVFDDDLAVHTSPTSVGLNGTSNPPTIGPGVNVTVTVSSRSLSTSVLSAEILYTFSYLSLNEVTTVVLPMYRLNSTSFRGIIPGMPVSSSLNFTVLVLDFEHHLDQSSPFAYSTQSLDSFVTILPQNESFFYVYVYDNASATYLSGVVVQIHGPTPAYNTVGVTRFGIAYPNATGNDFVPLLLSANVTYNVTITGLSVTGSAGGHDLSTLVLATNPMDARRTLSHGSDYIVVQEGNAVYFWMNGSISSTVFAPNVGSGGVAQIGATVGLIGSVGMALVTWRWVQQLQARRKAEEKRVTL